MKPRAQLFGCFVVPSPSDPLVDIEMAWVESRRNQSLNRQILFSNPSTLRVIEVYTNNYEWALFWSVRHPVAEWRSKFSRLAEEMAEAIEALRVKATKSGNADAKIVLERLQP